jgi:FixJ family two-component response regulator
VKLPSGEASSAPLVWIVDADPAEARRLEDDLAAHGVSVCTFASGDEMLYRSRSARPSLVVADVRLGDMSGTELVGLLRVAGVRAPVVMTARAHGDDLEIQARAAGIVHFAVKPVDVEAVLRILWRTLAEDVKGVEHQA